MSTEFRGFNACVSSMVFIFILFYLIHLHAGPRPPHSKKQNTSTRILLLQENILKEKNLEKWQCVYAFSMWLSMSSIKID